MAKMGVNRKLQTEIDRTLKKVDEGVALFDEIWDKVYSATQQNQKEKYEGDLKKEIKKLQRHRDSVKGWLQSNDIKDKTVLLEVRRRIESKMEQFKVCEKETKTKKFSKEGLAREAEMDPEEKEKMEKRDWLTERIQMLNTQLEGFEADVEKAMATVGKKKKAADSERIGVLENARKQHNYHIGRLEQMLRLLDNNDLAPEQVEIISEDLDWYISQAGDDIHLIEKFECEDAYDLYEALSLDELAAPGAPPVVKGTKKLEMLAEGDEEDGEGEGAGGDEAPLTTTKLQRKKSKAAAAAAAAGGLPLTIGRPVVKTVKEAAKIATPTPGVRPKTTAGGMPIIGRPVVSPAGPTLPAAPPSKVTKGPGMGDSPQAINHHQQHQQHQAAPGTQGQAMVSGGRMGAAGQTTPGQPMQPSGVSTPIKMVRGAPTDNLQTPQRQSGMAPALARTPPSGNAQLNSNANNSQTPSRQGGSQPHQHQSQQGHAPMSSFNSVAGPSSNMSNANPNSNQTGLTQQQHQLQHQNQQHELQQQQQQHQPGAQQKQHQPQQPQHQQQHQYHQQQQQPQQQHQQPPPPPQHQQQQQQQQKQQQLQMQHQHQQAAAQQHHPQQQQKQPQQQLHQQQQRMGQTTLKGPMDSSAGVGAPAEDDSSGMPIGMAQGQLHNQHHNALGTATAATARQSAEASGRAALEHSMMFRPQAEDSERSKPYVPRNPYRTPAAFPSQPAAAFEKPQMFEKLNTDTLFLIFYYQQGTYQQYLAARELKRQSWRYHKKYMTWFQRHEEPKITTDEYEQGTYVYFDYETGWCQRIKSDFRFDYVFLEDEAL